MRSTIHFYGGVGLVTGSNFLLESEDLKTLIDCGLFQGGAFAEEHNWEPFPYDPAEIPFLMVTHAHADHVGRIPFLVRKGFRGTIYSTEATKALALPLLRDSQSILAREAERLGKEILYTPEDIDAAMRLWKGIPYRSPQELPGGFTLELLNSGHIFGSAFVKFSREGRSVLFTGDVGYDPLLLPPRDSVAGINYLVMESVYGNRRHEGADPAERLKELERVVGETATRQGTLLIPAFSIERTQDLLIELKRLFEERRVPDMPVYLDSPLAQEVTRVFLSNPRYLRDDARKRVEGGEDIFAFPGLHMVHHGEESQRLPHLPGPKIILAGSGMSVGGRVQSHERELLPQKNATILIVGYQAPGTLGRHIMEGLKEVEIAREKIRVRAKVEVNLGYSAHLDGPHLMEMAEEAKDTLQGVYVVMGEPQSAGFLAQELRDRMGLQARAPEQGDEAQLEL